jgi:hypothetical protein
MWTRIVPPMERIVSTIARGVVCTSFASVRAAARGLLSMPIALRSSILAARTVVPRPQKGSHTV